MKVKNRKGILLLLSMILIASLVACSAGESEEGKVVDEFFTALKEQDIEKLDEIFPESGLGELMYNDEEGFDMYMNNMTWKVGEIEEDGEDKLVNITVRNSDMVSLLDEYEQVEGAQLPDFPKNAVDDTEKIDMDMKLRVVEEDGESKIEFDMESFFDVLNVMTGGVFKILEENN